MLVFRDGICTWPRRSHLGNGRAVGLPWREDPHVGRDVGEEGEAEGEAGVRILRHHAPALTVLASRGLCTLTSQRRVDSAGRAPTQLSPGVHLMSQNMSCQAFNKSLIFIILLWEYWGVESFFWLCVLCMIWNESVSIESNKRVCLFISLFFTLRSNWLPERWDGFSLT